MSWTSIVVASAVAAAPGSTDLTETVSARDNDLVVLASLDDLFIVTAALEPRQEREPAEVPGTPLPELFGAEGTWRIAFQGGYGLEPDEAENNFILGGVAWSYFIADDLAVVFEVNGMYFRQTRADAVGINGNILLRWHFLSEPNWSLYVDGGAGMLVATNEVPAEGSNFNFTPQLGVGVTVEVLPDTRLLIGIRWHHISNASLYEDNPGRDSLYMYTGISIAF